MADWHPIMAAVEQEPAVWDMIDPTGGVYGHIELRRTVGGPRYRVEAKGVVVGWATSLRAACKGLHEMSLRHVAPEMPESMRYPHEKPPHHGLAAG